MSAFSERVEHEDEDDRIGMLRARAAYDKVNMQMQIEGVVYELDGPDGPARCLVCQDRGCEFCPKV